jgi:Lrp/AsnC family transcriptional regulator, leucine-responsive regulatory protein
MSMAELGRRVGLSPPAVTERVQRLEQSGVIRGYHIDLSPEALGFPLSAYIRVRPGPGQLARIADLAVQVPEVVECHRITGDDCFLMRVYVRDVAHLETVLDQFLGYGQTNSSVVQSTVVQRRQPPIPG